jgi:hypothetical protein
LKVFKLTLLAASVVLLAACAGTPPEQTAKVVEQSAKFVPPAEPLTLEDINTAIEAGVQMQNEKGEEMICRREPKVGSRLARETVCMTKAEWMRVADEYQRATRKTMMGGKIVHGGT